MIKEDGNQQEYVCDACGSDIRSVRVAHPVQNRPFHSSDSDQFRYEMVPYCPNCEEMPNCIGMPAQDH